MNNPILLLGDDMSSYLVVVCVTIGTLVVVTPWLVGALNTVLRVLHSLQQCDALRSSIIRRLYTAS